MRLNFQQKLILSFFVIFTVFAVGIVVFEQKRARRYKTEALEERLDAYADQVSQYLLLNTRPQLDSLLRFMPTNLRLTLIDRSGKVLYDNGYPDPEEMENHSDRPEVAAAAIEGRGTFIRTSASVDRPYLYYAKDNGGSTIIRVALPYDIRVQSFLKPNNAFLYFMIALFLIGMGAIYYIGRYFGQSVKRLSNFSAMLNRHTDDILPAKFPDDEFGKVAARLAEDFRSIQKNEKQLAHEREKLLLHIQTSAEGVCFFAPDRKVAFHNGLFMQYFNMLSHNILFIGGDILNDPIFKSVADFLDNSDSDNYYETRIGAQGKDFLLRLNIFEDSSFEIILTDVTAQEKNRRMKQEMTGNIAHELRTPVTSIRGFLEILLDNEISENKSREYLERAYSQTKNLSELISDMSMLTRIDERQEAFDFTDVDTNKLLEKVCQDTALAREEKNISFRTDIPEGLTIRGNESLLYSVFRNLTDNVVHHAGESLDIEVKTIEIEDTTVCFSFADNGKGIADKSHLERLFERFYRVNEGRTRDMGGSGLGLSIVKHAVKLHGGSIVVRNRSTGGLEFIIRISK